MKCIYCREGAGFLKRTCPDCLKLVEAFNSLNPSFGFRELLDTLFATGVPNGKIELFLDSDAGGSGSLRDRITARMTNEVMTSLGQPSHLKGEDVQKVRRDIAQGKAPSRLDAEVIDYDQLPGKK